MTACLRAAIVLFVLMAPLPAAAQSVILSQYPPGQTTSASSLSVVLSSNHAAIVLGAGNANIGDVDVASIAAGDNNIGNIDIASIAAGDTNIGNVDVLTLPALVAGDADIGNVDLEIAGTAIAVNAGAASAQTLRIILASDDPAVVALQILDNAVSGAGFNITQLNGVNVTMGNGASGTGVQRMTLADDSTGRVRIWDGTDVLLIDGSGNLAVSCSNCTGSGVSAIDNSAFVGGTNTVASMGALFDATPPTITDGSIGAPRMDGSRYLYAVFPSAQAVTVSSGSITADTELATAAAASDNFANPTAGGVLAFNMVWDGSTWDRAATSLLTETAHDVALTPGSTTSLTTAFIAKDFDGAALPNAASAENDQVLGAATLSGVQLMMLVSEDGSLQYGTSTTPLVVGDGSGALNVICDSGCSGGTVYDHGEAIVIASSNGSLIGGRVSAAAPSTTGVADDDFAAFWVRNTGELVMGGAGTAGTASANVVTIQGIASMTPVIVGDGSGAFNVIVDSGTIAATQSGTWNVTNISGTVSLPTGASTLAEQQTQTTALQLLDNLVKAEDDASANLDPGLVIFARRTATPANTSGADLDYESLQINAGRLWVDPSGVTLTVASHAVTNAGTFAVQVDGAALTALQKIDNLAHSGSDVALVEHVPISGQFDDTSTTTVTENNLAPVRITAARSLNVNVAQIGGITPTAAVCDDPAKVTSTVINATASGNTELVSLTSSQIVYVCGYNFMSSGTADVRLVYGTGTACATGETGVTGLYPLTAQTGISVPNGGAVQAKGAASNALCIESSATVNVRGLLSYVKE